MNKTIRILLLIPLFSYCQEEIKSKSAYPNNVGDIEYDPKIDKENFELCGKPKIFQYFNTSKGFRYNGDKIALDKIFKEKYNSKIATKENGSIRIRFVVNCSGETDRFRIIAMDEDYKEKEFDKSITNQLLEITKNLNGWQTLNYKNEKINYYQYLIFKIKDGLITEILP